ncbi:MULTISPECIES: hypothetical protein [Aerococcaceae]|uniref:Uncharacterized protein n=1 Tax=Falseniella ignava CCUG 37419 TaxID=883112 RepID=K1LAS6_9LACT|nr:MULTISPECIES: hypothetical protein [Aerococcaceae]EKB53605.1 hypothetical protein HMPREF9707_01630 [Falseniella ignava CCUG 37419]
MSRMKMYLQVQEDAQNLVDSLNVLLSSMNNDDPVEDVEEEIHPVSFEAIQMFLAEKSRDGFTSEIRSLIQQFGSSKLSELDPKVYPDLWKAVEELADDQ